MNFAMSSEGKSHKSMHMSLRRAYANSICGRQNISNLAIYDTGKTWALSGQFKYTKFANSQGAAFLILQHLTVQFY